MATGTKSQGRTSKNKDKNEKKMPSEKNVPSLLSRLWFCWMFPMFYNGNKRDLEEHDLMPAKRMYESKLSGDKLER